MIYFILIYHLSIDEFVMLYTIFRFVLYNLEELASNVSRK